MKKLLIIELSEFNVDLLTHASQLYSLTYISKILQFKKSNYKTNDRYNSGYLTPAIQWEAIHKGLSSRHLRPCAKFFWQVLNDHHITTICENLEPYQGYRLLLKKAFKLGCLFKILKEIFKSRFKKNISQLDYLAALLFCAQKQKQNPQCSILFLRSLAYYQAHLWKENELEYYLKMIDKILGLLINQFPEDSFIIHNAIAQIKPGQWVPLGTIYSQDIHFPNHIFNYEFRHYIFHYFLPDTYTLKSEYIEDEAILWS